MTRKQLEADLKSKEWVDGIAGIYFNDIQHKDGGRLYRFDVREVVGNIGTYRNVDFFVFNEGLPTEYAFYKDAPPMKSIKTKEEQEDEQIIIASQRAKALAEAKKPI